MEAELFTTVITVSLVIALLSLVVVIAIVTYKRKQEHFLHEKSQLEQEYERRMMLMKIKVQEDTLKEIGTELHDNICQLLGSARNLLGVAERENKNLPQPIYHAGHTLDEAIKEIRAMSRTLNKEWLSQFDLYKNIEQAVYRINVTGSTKALFTRPAFEINLDKDAQLILFRVIQEAIQNSIRHGAPSCIKIGIMQTHQIEVGIEDDGAGFNSETIEPQGMGLLNMKERVNLLCGSIFWHPIAGGGTRVTILLPLAGNISHA